MDASTGVVRIPVSVAPLEKKADAKTGSGNLESGADKSDSIQSVAKHLAQQIQEHLKASGAMPSSDTVTESAQVSLLRLAPSVEDCLG